jgi:alkylhydroperoxidase family enzyme
MSAAPRISPGSRREIGFVNSAITRLIGVATRTGPPNVFTTLARNRRLFRRWLWFAGALMPGGKLPRADTELVILRVAHNCGSDYEWGHHVRLGKRAGLDQATIERVRSGPGAPEWTDRQRMLLSAADELHADRFISDPTWTELEAALADAELIELCMLVGHYEMLAMTLNSLEVQPDEG